jgi:hypothetical protein
MTCGQHHIGPSGWFLAADADRAQLGGLAEYAESVVMRSYALDAERTVSKPIDPAGVWMAAASS